MTEHTEELPTDPKGSEPPLESSLVSEMRTMFSSLLENAIGGLRSDITDATKAAAQVSEQLGRFNTNIEAIRHELHRLAERVTVLEHRQSDVDSRLDALEKV